MSLKAADIAKETFAKANKVEVVVNHTDEKLLKLSEITSELAIKLRLVDENLLLSRLFDVKYVEQLKRINEDFRVENVEQPRRVNEDLRVTNVEQLRRVNVDEENVEQLRRVTEDEENVEQPRRINEDFPVENVEQPRRINEDFPVENVEQLRGVNVDEENVEQLRRVTEDEENVEQPRRINEDFPVENVEQARRINEDFPVENVEQLRRVNEDLRVANVEQLRRVNVDEENVEQHRRIRKTEKENVRDEDVQDEVRKIIETRTLKTKESTHNEGIKLRYSPMSKPGNLSIRDILDGTHISPIIPSQRISSSNDFMGQNGGDTNSSSGRNSVVSQTVSEEPSIVIHASQIGRAACSIDVSPEVAMTPEVVEKSQFGKAVSGVDVPEEAPDEAPDATEAVEKPQKNRKKRNKKGGSQSVPVEPQKIINALPFESAKITWVRPSILAMGMTEEEKSLFEIQRAVCSILNKLTPQNFKPLVKQMMALEIDSSAKLESVIGLIFEKAISEPGFSVAYANMCRVLTNQFSNVPVSGSEIKQTVSFRKLLLNRCQTEFKKLFSDEKECSADKSKTFETEELKNRHEELNYREMQNRRRMLGNIRFIGELYKLKMISEPMMHDHCIYKLLKVEKLDSLEDQLECSAKLLATTGKELDHVKAKPRMDQYFDQIGKITEKRKISSRIKFLLKDVIDLRSNAWVPRRAVSSPMPIFQIRRDAQRAKADDIFITEFNWQQCPKNIFVMTPRLRPSGYHFKLNI